MKKKRAKTLTERGGVERRHIVNLETFIKQEGRKVPVIKILYWLVLAVKQQSNMSDLWEESLRT